MRFHRSPTALAWPLVALLAGCNREGAAPAALPEPSTPAIAEKEPNDDSKSAQVIDGDALVRGDHGPNDDWFEVKASSPSIIRIELGATEGVAPSVEALDADKNKVLKVVAAAPGAEVVVPGLRCTGSCFIHVDPESKTATGTYKLTVTAKGIGERSEQEPNSRVVDAQVLPVGSGVDGWIASGDDEDWFRVDTIGTAADQVLSVAVKSPPAVRLELTAVRISDQAPMGSWKAPDVGVDLRVRDLGLPPAPETGWLLVLKSAWVQPNPKEKSKRLSDTRTPYSIDVRPMAGVPGLLAEPNDSALRASVLVPAVPAAGGAATAQAAGFIAPKGDADWFTFKLEQASILTAEVSGVDRVNLQLSVIDPAKKDDEKDNELVKVNQGDVKEGEIAAGIALPAGDNFLRVEGAFKKIDDKWVRDFENQDVPYTLTVSVEPDDGTHEREPNDVAERSTPVTLGKEYRGFIQPAGDVDTYRLEVTETTNVTLNVTGVPKLDLTLTVRDPSRTDDKGKFAIVGTVDRAKLEGDERLVIPFEPGSYLIEVADKAKQSNPQKRYSLSIK